MLGLIRMLGLAPTAGSAPADAEVSRREPAVPRNPLPVRERQQLASRPPSITDLLPWRDFDEKTGTFLLEDGVSRALLYELDPMPSEAC